MKKVIFFSMAALFTIIVGCDNAANMEAMKAQTMRTIDSLALAEVNAQRATLLTQCNQGIDAAIKSRVDSLMAIATPVKTLTGAGKTNKPAPAKPKPAPVKPVAPVTPSKPAVKPPSELEIQKSRGQGGTTNTAASLQEQKTRGTSTIDTKNGTTATTSVATPAEQLKQQKTRGAVTPK